MATHKRGWWQRLGRVLRHRWYDETDSERALNAAALDRLTAQVRSSEQRHSGELRICVEAGLPLSDAWRDATPRERALAWFGKLRVWDTEHNNGVLIYLLLAERAVEVVADRGLARHVPPEQWAALVQQLTPELRAGRYEEALAVALRQVDAWLLQHFALQPGQANPNELPDAPLRR